MTNVTLFDFITEHMSCDWWETIHGTRLKQLSVVYLKKYTLCQSIFCRIINAFPCVLKDVDIIFLVCNQLELTNSVNIRLLSLPYDIL